MSILSAGNENERDALHPDAPAGRVLRAGTRSALDAAFAVAPGDDPLGALASTPSGQLWYVTEGGGADSRVARINNDGTGHTVVIDNSPVVDPIPSAFVADVGVDTAAGFYFTLANAGTSGLNAVLIRGAIGSSASPVTVVDFADNIIVNGIQVDAINNRIYVGYQDGGGSAPAGTGIRVYSYNPTNGALTDLGFLVTSATDSRGQESGLDVLDPRDFALDSSIGRLFYTEVLTGGVNVVGLYRLDLANPTVTTQLVSQAQFPDSGVNGYIQDVEVDQTTDRVYFTTQSQAPSGSGGYNPAHNALWWIDESASSGTATQVTLVGMPGGALFYPGDMTFDQHLRQLYIESEEGGAGSGDDVIYVFQLDAAGGVATLIHTLAPSPAFGGVAANIQGMVFAQLAHLDGLSGTATTASEQGAAVVLLNAAPTITDFDGDSLAGATVQITGGRPPTSAADDHLGYGAAMQTAGLVAGTNITLAWDAASATLTLTGYDTFANYQAVLAAVRFWATGDNPTNGNLNTSRTITWTIHDGTPGVTGSVVNTGSTTVGVAAANDPHTGGASLTGTATAGQVLTAVSTLADADGLGTLHYQWQRDTGSGFVNVGADQSTYTLGAGDVGGVLRVVISYTDGQGFAESAASAASASVSGGAAPTAVDDAASVNENAVLNASVFGNDSDPDGPALTVSAVNGSGAGVGVQITLPSGALLTLNADGTYAYDPNGVFDWLGAGYSAVDSFTYAPAGGNTATVTVTINGVDSNDVITGDLGANILNGGIGDDILSGGPGTDVMDGGDGVDTADYASTLGGVVVGLNNGAAVQDGYAETDVLTNIENVIGSAFNDLLIGSAAANTLEGGAGADVLIGLDGNDSLIGGAGAANQLQGGLGDDDYYVEANDTVVEFLNQGNDRVFTSRNFMTLAANVEELHYTGGSGNFTGVGNGLDNVIVGDAGADVLSGRGGADVLIGAGGIDTVTYAAAASGVSASLLTGAVGTDGDGGSDTLVQIENLIGSAFGDNLVGDDGANTVYGGAGNDIIRGNGGADLLQGGTGVDYVSYSTATSGVVVRLDLNTAQDGMGGTDTIVAFENVAGSAHDDTIVGDAAGNVLQGGGGADILIGRGGADILLGGAGAANTLYGGAGDDWYTVEAADTIVELAGEGTDTVLTARNHFTLAANVEVLNFNGTGNFAGTGNASDNAITGGDGLDTLIGGGGNDALDGGLGSDTARYSGSAAQYLIEDLGGGRYRVTDTVGGRDGVDILTDIERISFSDGSHLLAGLGAPALSAKEAPAEVSPLMDDGFVASKDLDLPLVLPGDDFDAAPQPASALPGATGADMLSVDGSGALAPAPEDLRGVHHHDDWML